MLFRKLIIPTLLFLQAQSVLGQDTLYFNRYYEQIEDSTDARFLEIRKYNPVDSNQITLVTMQGNGLFISIQKYSDFKNRILQGRCRYWYPNGKLHQEADYVNDKLQGQLKTYYENGQVKRNLTYDNDTIVSGRFFNEDGTPKVEVFKEDLEESIIDQMPSFPGGETGLQLFLMQNINYPEALIPEFIRGTVVASFVVTKQGTLRDIKILESPHPLCSEEVVRVLKKMPRWEPGRLGVLPMNVRHTLPVRFWLQ